MYEARQNKEKVSRVIKKKMPLHQSLQLNTVIVKKK